MPKNKINFSVVRKILLVCVVALIAVNELYYRFGNIPSFFAESVAELVFSSLTRVFGGIACVIFMVEFEFSAAMKLFGNKSAKYLLAIIPPFVVAVNNFPFIGYFSGNAPLTKSPAEVVAFAFFCLSVGFFEELAFRGCGLVFLLEKMKKTRLGVFLAVAISSVVFGFVHILNGAGAFLQIGYSALIGALCCVVFLATNNIWLCVIIHAVYNFCGSIMNMSNAWTKEQIIFTAVISVPIALYTVWLFFKIPLENAEALYKREKKVSTAEKCSNEEKE